MQTTMAVATPCHWKTVKLRWRNYLRTTQNELTRNSAALDGFLRAFLSACQASGPGKDDKERPAYKFSDMKSVSNLLAGELLVEVHQVCSTSDDDDTSHLQRYLLQGRGATLLKVLNTIGVEGLSCSRELGDLLANLIPLCCKFSSENGQNYVGQLGPMDDCFRHLLIHQHASTKTLSKFPTLTEVTSVRNPTNSVDRHANWPTAASRTSRIDYRPAVQPSSPGRPAAARRRASAASDDASTDSDSTGSQGRVLSGIRYTRDPAIHRLGAASQLGVFPGLLQGQPDEDGEQEQRSDYDDAADGGGRSSSQPLKMEPLELCLTMLELMEALCAGDSDELAQTRVVSFILLPHLAALLLDLAGSTAAAVSAEGASTTLVEGWTTGHQLRLLRSLSRTCLSVMSHAGSQPNGVAWLNKNRCLLTVIEATKMVAQALSAPALQSETSALTQTGFEMLLFVDEMLYGLLMLIHSLVQSLPLNPSILSSSLKLLNDFCDQGLRTAQMVLHHWECLLLDPSIPPSQHSQAKDCIVGLVTAVGHVLNSLKRAKVNYIHTMKCLRRKHRTCEFSHHRHHHHDVLGVSAASLADCLVTLSDSYGSMEVLTAETSDPAGQSECVIAVLGDFLLQIFVDAKTPLLHVRILACVEQAGLCCCMPPGRIQRHLLMKLDKHNSGLRSYILCILTKVLMDFCGGSAEVQRQARNICSLCWETDTNVDAEPWRPDASDSALSSSEASLHEASKVCHPKWHCLRQFLPLLRHRNEALAVQVTQHLLRLTSQASAMFKQHLFHTVFLPLLRHLKKVFLDPRIDQVGSAAESQEHSGDLCETVIQYCLSVLPLLLHSQMAQDLFHNCGGLRLLAALIRIRSLRKCVLKMFQVLIVLEERTQKAVQESEERPTTVSTAETSLLSDGASARVTADTEGDDNNLTVCQAFMQIVFAQVVHIEPRQGDHPIAASMLKSSTEDVRVNDGTSALLLPSDREDLCVMCDVWLACATLFPCSYQFQHKFLSAGGHKRALCILRSVLQRVVNVCEEDLAPWIVTGRERCSSFHSWLTLMESTLFICLGTCSNWKVTFETDELTVADILQEVRRTLEDSQKLAGPALRAVCDSLLSCATAHRNMHDIVNNHTFAVMHLRIDDSDEQEISEVSDYCSTAKESETCHTEQGYEADSEFTPDEHTKLEGQRSGRRLRTVRAPTHVMHYPAVARLTLELLLARPMAPPPEDGVLGHVLLRLTSLAKQSPHIASALYNEGMVEILLDGIQKTGETEPQHQVERQLMLDLFLLISQHAFSSRELAAFLALFKQSSLPTGALLCTATALVEAFRTKPTFILVFPVLETVPPTVDVEMNVQSTSSEDVAATQGPVSLVPGDDKQSEYAQLLRSSSVQEAIDIETVGSVEEPPQLRSHLKRSPLTCTPIQMSIQKSLQWPTTDKAFSLSLWIQLEGVVKDVAFLRRTRRLSRHTMDVSAEMSQAQADIMLPTRLREAMSRSASGRIWKDRCLHLATVRSQQHQLQLWIEPETGSIMCRRVVVSGEEEVVTGETCLSSLLGFGCWEHLTINYEEKVDGGGKKAVVAAFVNGCYSREVTFTLTSGAVSTGRPPTTTDSGSGDQQGENWLLVGHALPPDCPLRNLGSWHMGNLMLFRGAVLTQSVSFHLYTLGPDCCSLALCDAPHLPAEYSRHVTRDLLLQSEVNLEMFTTNQNVSIQHLRENQLLTYTPGQSATFNRYCYVTPSGKGRSQSDGPQHGIGGLYQQPDIASVRFLSDVAAQAHTSLYDALKEIGGIGVFLYLFASVVEQRSSEQDQAQALRLLFTLIMQSPQHAQEFGDMGGYAMLAKVLSSSKCVIGYELLQVMLDAMVTRPVMRYDPATREHVLHRESSALIRDVRVVSELLLAWRVWDRDGEAVHVWRTAFDALEVLVRDDHPHQQYNIKQLQNIGVVDKLLIICLERIQDARPSLPVPICSAILRITAGMLGHPPDVHVVMTICDFLLLIHPAASTYIHHTPRGFYFVQKWAQNDGHRRGSISNSGSGSQPALTSTPIKETLLDSSSEVAERGKLSRSQSLPSSTFPVNVSRRRLAFEHSQALSSTDIVHNAQTPERTLELDSLLPALIIDKKSPANSTSSNMEASPPTSREQSGASDTNSHDQSPVTFFVESDLGRSSVPKKSQKSDTSTPASNRQCSEENGNGGGQPTMQPMQTTSPLEIPSSSLAEEDENGNSPTCMTGNESMKTPPTQQFPQLSSSAPEYLEDTVETLEDQILSGGWNSILGSCSPTSAATGTYPVKEEQPEKESYHVDPPVDEEEAGLVYLSVGLIDLLCNVLVLLPEGDLSKFLGVILKPETLLVMVHHQAPQVRKAIVRLMDMYFQRSAAKQRELFLRQQGLHLLATQLHQHAATQSILEACFSILFGRQHALEDGFEAHHLADISRFQRQAIVPIFALLESASSSAPLIHHTLLLLIKMFDGVECLMPVMLENALIETLCNVVAAVHASLPPLTCNEDDERHIVIKDLQHFFAIIAEKTFSTSGVAYYQHFEDSLTLLQALETNEIALYGEESKEVGNVRSMRAHMLKSVLDYICRRLAAPANKLSQTSLSHTVGSLLSLFPAKILESAGTHDSSSVPSFPASHQSAPANISNGLIHSSSGSYHSDSTGGVPDWSLTGGHNPSVTTRAFHGNKKMETGQTEFLERFKKVIVLASGFVMFSVPLQANKELMDSSRIITFEQSFSRLLVEFLLRGIISGMERSFFQRKTLHNTIMWQSKDVLRVQFSRLLAHMMAPNQVLGQRLFVIDLLTSEPKVHDILKIIVNVTSLGQKLVFYVYELLVTHLDKLSRTCRQEADEFITVLQRCGLTPLRIGCKVSPELRNAIDEDQKLWENEVRRDRGLWLKKHEVARHRLLSRVDTFARRISGCAMELTQNVVNAQNAERRKFVEHIKAGMSHRLSVKKRWQQLIQMLSHERAAWHCPKSYPTSWQLDPTEGPSRVRRRLQRCHLDMSPRYLTAEHRAKLEAEKRSPPLSYLFDDDAMSSDSAALIYRLHTNEKIQHTCRCSSVTPCSETPGELLIGQTSVYFVGDEAIMDANYTQVLLGNKDLLSMTLPNEDMTEIHKRWYQLRDIGLEIFLTNGKTCLLAFENTRERDQVCRLLLAQELPSLLQAENLTAIQQLWLDGRLTNFEYLTHLNKMAGRSFNDLMQYPVFPFVLSNYSEPHLDLDSAASYRNLAKPISVQQKEREKKYVENYRWLQMEKERLANQEPGIYQPDPYHYGSHYSNSGTVLHFLVRMPPFTQMFLVYQDQNFDLPDRTFHSVNTAWTLASNQSPTDVKELIPEFFFLPEFLYNTEGFDFGVRQDGVRVWDVVLPPWCNSNPRLLTLIHRQALESDHVTQHLATWIDLVFGFKQTGKAAIDAINVFHPATYFGKDVESIDDPVRRMATKTMIKTYGQTPKQLFRTPHPSPSQPRSSTKEKCPALQSVSGLRWGKYVGSPDEPDPVLAWSKNYGTMIASLVALPTDDVFGLGVSSCLLVMYSKEKGVTAVTTTDVLWAAIISWNHADGIVRIQNRRSTPAVNFLNWGNKEKITCCASVPDCRLLFFGSTSGVVTIFNTKSNEDKVSNLQVFGRRHCLYGHAGAITSIHVCKPYSILVTASTDKTAIIWDLNRLCYVRSITEHQHPLSLVTVSETSGDIATVSNHGGGCVLKLHTINASLVATIRSRKVIHCLAFSTAPEGRSINILAGGLNTGAVRLWSTWDLSVVRDIICEKLTRPIASLSFTQDSQRLYVSDITGTVAVFERPRPANAKPKAVSFISFL